jgi:hypothetical protein
VPVSRIMDGAEPKGFLSEFSWTAVQIVDRSYRKKFCG